MFVKKAATDGVPLDPHLRTNLQKLVQSTQEFVIFLQVSSFANNTRPPPSPAPSLLLSPTYEERALGYAPPPQPQAQPAWRGRNAAPAGSPPHQSPNQRRDPGMNGNGALYQAAMGSNTRETPWASQGQPGSREFRMPGSPGARIRHAGGVVGYKDSD